MPDRNDQDDPIDPPLPEPGLVAKIVAIDEALDEARLPHAFGGALALAWCTEQARGTNDIDVNVFIDAAVSAEALSALPAAVSYDERDVERCRRDGQVRVWWGRTPVDVFTDTTDFHRAAAARVVTHDFAGRAMAFLHCSDLAVFKAFSNRSKDWVDLEAMHAVGQLDVARTLGTLVQYLGTGDERVERFRDLVVGDTSPGS